MKRALDSSLTTLCTPWGISTPLTGWDTVYYVVQVNQ
jgi:hypothetical protein